MKHNVDLHEIAKFDALANDWWNPEGKMKPLHMLNPVRLDYIKQHVNLQDKKILDVGCGGGILTEALAKESNDVSGIDFSEQAINIAKQHAGQENLSIRYFAMTIEDLVIQEAHSYDVITCMEMLEHVPNPAQIILACARLLKPNGFVFFSTLNRTVKAYLTAIIGAEYILNLLPKGTHSYARFIRPSELVTWSRKAKLNLKNLSGIDYSLSAKNFSLSKDVSVNYLAAFNVGE